MCLETLSGMCGICICFVTIAELFSTFKRSLKTELFDIASYRKREHSA